MSFIDDVVLDADTPINVKLCAKYKRSFAYTTVQSRLPVILTQVVDNLSRCKEQIIKEYGEGAREELKAIIGSFSKLKNEMQTNKSILLLTTDAVDIPIWNGYLKEESEKEDGDPRWFCSPWLYVECYMYRRCWQAFEQSIFLRTFDPFRQQKEKALHNSMAAITILADYVQALQQIKNYFHEDDVRLELLKLVHVNLWGNRCDLSMSSGAEIVLTEDPLEKVNDLREYILVDDSDKIWQTLAANINKTEAVVDIVLDNAGYELFTDLCLADFLCTFMQIGKIRFHAKAMPWFISDTLPYDFDWTMQTLASSTESSSLPVLATRWKTYLQSGKWVVQTSAFWTLPHDYSKMKTVDSELYEYLSEAALVIFKGDLNYRKLTGDINWTPTEVFSKVLRGFYPTKLVSLRTIKADVICGLADGQAEAVAAKSADWLLTGQYAVVQFNG